MSEIEHKCGIFGVFNSSTPARDIYMGLHELQHRGQEGAGLSVKSYDTRTYSFRRDGIVTEAFEEYDLKQVEQELDDYSYGIGHVRYSTSGALSEDCKQPIIQPTNKNLKQSSLQGIVHNGHITNATLLKDRYDLSSNVDTQVIFDIISFKLQQKGITKSVKETLQELKGAFSLICLMDDGIIVIRDSNGFRPLFVGEKKDTQYLASETSAFQILDARTIGRIEPGQMWQLKFQNNPKNETFSIEGINEYFNGESENGLCSFEPIYFSKPDSHYGMTSVHEKRVEMGRELWKQSPVEDADLVTEVPDSANSATQGVAKESGLPYEITLLRSHYTGRTFIQPYQELRNTEVRRKFSLIPGSVAGKNVVIIDDSIVRGTTMKFIVELLKQGDANQIHLRIASPPLKHPCYYGIDIPTEEELIANKFNEDELAKELGVDSLEYLSVDRMHKVLNEDHCDACFTGDYPTETQYCLEKEKKQ